MIIQNRSELPTFDPELDEAFAQPVSIMDQDEFIAVIQWDGAGEDQHWVLVPKGDVETFIAGVRKVASQ